MSTKTTNYEFLKPEATDFISPDDFNSNFDALDELVKGISDDVTTLQTDINGTNENADSLKKRVATNETNIANLVTKTDTTNTNLDTANSNITLLGERMTTAESDIDALQSNTYTVANITDFPTVLSYFTNDKNYKSITTTEVTIPVASWDSTSLSTAIAVSDVTADNDVIVAAAPDSLKEAGKHGVYASAQAAGLLTLTCKSVPTAAITMYVMTFTE